MGVCSFAGYGGPPTPLAQAPFPHASEACFPPISWARACVVRLGARAGGGRRLCRCQCAACALVARGLVRTFAIAPLLSTAPSGPGTGLCGAVPWAGSAGSGVECSGSWGGALVSRMQFMRSHPPPPPHSPCPCSHQTTNNPATAFSLPYTYSNARYNSSAIRISEGSFFTVPNVATQSPGVCVGPAIYSLTHPPTHPPTHRALRLALY